MLARWSDCRYYPAKVLNINKNGTYRMLFYDGIEKNVLATNIRVMPDELKAQVCNMHLNRVYNAIETVTCCSGLLQVQE